VKLNQNKTSPCNQSEKGSRSPQIKVLEGEMVEEIVHIILTNTWQQCPAASTD